MKKFKYFCINFPIIYTWLNAGKMWKEVTLHLFVKMTWEVLLAAQLFQFCFFSRVIVASLQVFR